MAQTAPIAASRQSYCELIAEFVHEVCPIARPSESKAPEPRPRAPSAIRSTPHAPVP